MSLALLFSGQGGHNPDMFRLLTDKPELMKYLEEACASIGVGVSETEKLLKEKILPNKYAQPLICAFCYGIWQGLKDSLPKPSYFAGFSLGELSAYACAGAFDFTTLIKLSISRAEFMDEAVSDDITVIAVKGMPVKEIEEECDKSGTYIMIVSGPSHVTVGGNSANMEKFRSNLNCETVEIALKVPSHTPLMKTASEKFEKVLREIKFANPSIPVIAGIDGSIVRNASSMVSALSTQICKTLRWDICMRNLYERRINVFLESGPGRTLSHITEENLHGISARSIDDFRTLPGICDWVMKHNM